ncbi:MAG: tRNA adenosine(34) deaminase TadA [Gammaproteobacteria bacterium]
MAISDIKCMQRALALARQGQAIGEVPVGAVIALNGAIIGEGFNQPISGNDPTLHAEIVALRAAATVAGNYRLPGATIYVTLEPCVMCAGALVHARIERLVYATFDPKTGAAGSIFQIADTERLNHRIKCECGLLGDESALLLSKFFKQRRSSG